MSEFFEVTAAVTTVTTRSLRGHYSHYVVTTVTMRSLRGIQRLLRGYYGHYVVTTVTAVTTRSLRSLRSQKEYIFETEKTLNFVPNGYCCRSL